MGAREILHGLGSALQVVGAGIPQIQRERRMENIQNRQLGLEERRVSAAEMTASAQAEAAIINANASKTVADTGRMSFEWDTDPANWENQAKQYREQLETEHLQALTNVSEAQDFRAARMHGLQASELTKRLGMLDISLAKQMELLQAQIDAADPEQKKAFMEASVNTKLEAQKKLALTNAYASATANAWLFNNQKMFELTKLVMQSPTLSRDEKYQAILNDPLVQQYIPESLQEALGINAPLKVEPPPDEPPAASGVDTSNETINKFVDRLLEVDTPVRALDKIYNESLSTDNPMDSNLYEKILARLLKIKSFAERVNRNAR